MERIDNQEKSIRLLRERLRDLNEMLLPEIRQKLELAKTLNDAIPLEMMQKLEEGTKIYNNMISPEIQQEAAERAKVYDALITPELKRQMELLKIYSDMIQPLPDKS